LGTPGSDTLHAPRGRRCAARHLRLPHLAAFTRLEVYQHICRRSDVADSLRLYLPPTATTARFFFFDKERRGFAARERELLQVLRPHLALWRRRWRAVTDPRMPSLTRREVEILEAVAGGETNREIAEQLWISPHTVRTHLEHVFEKLGVRTRTEAAALLRRDTGESIIPPRRLT
jgi:DNA-binding CsgD family transcriptional regulator